MTAASRTTVLVGTLAAAALSLAGPAAAHSGFGGPAVETRFVFPPWAVWAAGALVVAATFAVLGASATRAPRPARYTPGADAPTPPGWTWPRRAAALVLIAASCVALVPGTDSVLPQTLWWLGVWALLPLLSYTLGDVWSRVSPFEALRPRLSRMARRGPAAWPAWLGAWPAALLFVVLVGAEVAGVAWLHEARPLAALLSLYVAVTIMGVLRFGGAWLDNVELVTRSLRWWAAASPVVWSGGKREWIGFGRALERLPVRRADDVAFTVALLYGVNFDGFVATPLGASALVHLRWLGVPAPLWVILVAGYLLFLVVWWLAARGIRNASRTLEPVHGPARAFAASLIPIAVGYHLAHNLFYVVEHAPRFVLALLDPLGFGAWPDPLGHLPATLALPAWGATFAALQVALVLVGHVVAVVVAHHLARVRYASRVQALRSEIPLTVVMVAYTWIGLWILSGAHGGAAA